MLNDPRKDSERVLRIFLRANLDSVEGEMREAMAWLLSKPDWNDAEYDAAVQAMDFAYESEPCVYLVGEECEPGKARYVKVGVTTTGTAERMKGLQTGNPRPLVLIAEYAGGFDDERSLHRLLSDHHVLGEWFNWCEDAVKIVEDYFSKTEEK